MEVVTKVACGSVIAGGGGAAGAYGIHRWSASHESESEVPAPAPNKEQTVSEESTGSDDHSETTEDNLPKADGDSSGEQAGVQSTAEAGKSPEAAGSVTNEGEGVTTPLLTETQEHSGGDGGVQTQHNDGASRDSPVPGTGEVTGSAPSDSTPGQPA